MLCKRLASYQNSPSYAVCPSLEDTRKGQNFATSYSQSRNFTKRISKKFATIPRGCEKVTEQVSWSHKLIVGCLNMSAEATRRKSNAARSCKKLQSFVRAANPFTEVFSEQFMIVYQRHLQVQDKEIMQKP